MDLKWDRNLIRKNLEILKSRGIENLTMNDIMMINIYNAYLLGCNTSDIDMSSYDIEDDNSSTTTLIKNIKIVHDDLIYYLKKTVPIRFKNQIYTLIESMGFYCLISDLEYLRINKQPEEQIKEKSINIYNTISKRFQKPLNYIYDNNLVFIKGANKKKVLTKSSCCCVDYYNNYPFISITRNEEYSPISVLNHELCHAICYLENKDIFRSILCETHPIYMIFYTNDLLYKKTNDNNYLKSMENYLIDQKSIIGYMYILFKICSLEKMNEKTIKNCLEENSFFDTEDLNATLRLISSQNYKSMLDYLIAGILTSHLLSFDKEKSRYLFTKSFYDTGSINTILKNMELKLNDITYSYEIFNNFSSNIKTKIRKKVQ